MFKRKDESYEFNSEMLHRIMLDEASPLNRITSIVPENSKILDVGAGNGLLGKLFDFMGKKVTIDGVEPNKFASSLAKDTYRKFYNGYIEEFTNEILLEQYDYIIFADVIEHIANPVSVLGDFFLQLEATTKIIISTPNIAFGSIRLSLMLGRFDYVDSGILEKTHLRFYTQETLFKLIEVLSLKIVDMNYLLRNFNLTEVALSKYKLNPWLIHFVSKDELSHVYQFLLVLTNNKNFVNTNVKAVSYGNKTKHPVLEYYFKDFIVKNQSIKKLVKRFYKL